MNARRIRILHAADLHLGSSFASLGVDSVTGNKLRGAQRKVFRRILETARHWPADALCIAGDLFDGVHAGEDLLDEILGMLEEAAPLPVYIAPGSSDPFVTESPYALALWPENVTVFPPGKWHAALHSGLPLTVHGLGYDGARDQELLSEGLNIPRDGRIHIAVTHGTIPDVKGEKKYAALFKHAIGANNELAYLAMGYFHETTEIGLESNTVAWSPGAPQGRNSDETESRHILQVEITREDGGVPCVSVIPVDVSEILFERLNLDIARAADAAALFGALCAKDPREKVVHLCLHGARPAQAEGIVTDLRNMTNSLFLYADIEDNTIIGQETLVPVRDNSCLSKLIELMGSRILDETIRENALRESEALELMLNACHTITPSTPEEGFLFS